MGTTIEQMKSDLSRLPEQQRAEIALFLIHSLDQDADDDAGAAWDAELVRRAAAIRQGTAASEPAEAVMAELRARAL